MNGSSRGSSLFECSLVTRRLRITIAAYAERTLRSVLALNTSNYIRSHSLCVNREYHTPFHLGLAHNRMLLGKRKYLKALCTTEVQCSIGGQGLKGYVTGGRRYWCWGLLWSCAFDPHSGDLLSGRRH